MKKASVFIFALFSLTLYAQNSFVSNIDRLYYQDRNFDQSLVSQIDQKFEEFCSVDTNEYIMDSGVIYDDYDESHGDYICRTRGFSFSVKLNSGLIEGNVRVTYRDDGNYCVEDREIKVDFTNLKCN